MHTCRSQRWRDRREHFVPASTEIDPRRFSVDVIDTRRDAAPFVLAHHYSGSMPVARLSVGLFRDGRGGRPELAGVCVFTVPINNASVPKSAGLMDSAAACDLGRFVLLDDVGGNGESFFLSRALRWLRREKPDILSVISYADPVRRVGTDGQPSARLRGRAPILASSVATVPCGAFMALCLLCTGGKGEWLGGGGGMVPAAAPGDPCHEGHDPFAASRSPRAAQ